MKNSRIEIRSRKDILKLDESVEEVEIKIKPTIKMIAQMLDHGTNLKRIKISEKLKSLLRKKVWDAIEDMNIKVIEYKAKRGRRFKYHLSKEEINKIKKEVGKSSIRKVASKFGISKSTIHRIIKRGKYE